MILPVVVSLLVAERVWLPAEEFCRLTDERVTESSGVAASLGQKDTFYTHNDSGDSARFFRFNGDGKVTGVFSLKGVKALDWEDMEAARVGGKDYLYFGDIGDNERKRKSIVIYRVIEPKGESRVLNDYETYTLTYPDRARDCEALFVDAKRGDIYLVTKARDGETVVYMLAKPGSTGKYLLTKLGNLDFKLPGIGANWVTAASCSPDGAHVVVRGYGDAKEYDVPKLFGEWWKSAPRTVKLAGEKQGEAICYSRDGGAILTSSEGSPCPVSRVPLKISGRS